MVVVCIAIQFYPDKLACSPPLTEVRVLPGSKVTSLLINVILLYFTLYPP